MVCRTGRTAGEWSSSASDFGSDIVRSRHAADVPMVLIGKLAAVYLYGQIADIRRSFDSCKRWCAKGVCADPLNGAP